MNLPESSISVQVSNALIRVLGLIDSDSTSYTYGVADRIHWAWSMTDYVNLTSQGAVNGLALLYSSGQWPLNTAEDVFINRIDSLIDSISRFSNKDNSVNQAFPNEGSYALSGFLAFDVLTAISALEPSVDSKLIGKWMAVADKLVSFLFRSSETHGIISNHLAGISAALFRWHSITGNQDAERLANKYMRVILDNQSSEGWYLEYNGFDAGYQTLCIHYLSEIYSLTACQSLKASLIQSVKFLSHFAHPDGSFGGIYGSRCTRFYHPSGIQRVAEFDESALRLHHHMLESITNHKVATLASVDDSNLIPFFNTYVKCLVSNSPDISLIQDSIELPCHSKICFQKDFRDAGIYIDRGANHYSLINYKKGGALMHFLGKTLVKSSSGTLCRKKQGTFTFASTHTKASFISCTYSKVDNSLKIKLNGFFMMSKAWPSPLQFIALRSLSLSLFRYTSIRELFKRLIVRRLITKSSRVGGGGTRTVYLGENLTVNDQFVFPRRFRRCDQTSSKSFVPFHMASKAYWQLGDELNNP